MAVLAIVNEVKHSSQMQWQIRWRSIQRHRLSRVSAVFEAKNTMGILKTKPKLNTVTRSMTIESHRVSTVLSSMLHEIDQNRRR